MTLFLVHLADVQQRWMAHNCYSHHNFQICITLQKDTPPILMDVEVRHYAETHDQALRLVWGIQLQNCRTLAAL